MGLFMIKEMGDDRVANEHVLLKWNLQASIRQIILIISSKKMASFHYKDFCVFKCSHILIILSKTSGFYNSFCLSGSIGRVDIEFFLVSLRQRLGNTYLLSLR